MYLSEKMGNCLFFVNFSFGGKMMFVRFGYFVATAIKRLIHWKIWNVEYVIISFSVEILYNCTLVLTHILYFSHLSPSFKSCQTFFFFSFWLDWMVRKLVWWLFLLLYWLFCLYFHFSHNSHSISSILVIKGKKHCALGKKKSLW